MTTPSSAPGTPIVLLDGGVGQELYRRSTCAASPLWSVQVMIDEPALVEAVHLEFIEAGARIVTVNTYTATPHRLDRAGRGDMFDALHAAAVAAAQSAREKSGQRVRIAGCLPPLVGSYRADLTPPEDVCLADYRRIVAAQAAHVDLFLCETMLSAAEARAAATAAGESGRPVWTALSVDDADGTRLRSGEGVADGAGAAVEAGAEAVLINCSSPEAVTAAVPLLAGVGVPFGAYANGFVSVAALQPGKTVEVLEARDDLDPARYADHALEWVAAGATIVGGCCEIGPAHIAALGQRLVAGGHALVSAPPVERHGGGEERGAEAAT